MQPYQNCKVYGPYRRKDGRLHVCIKLPNGKMRTVSYPKYYMEIKLGRYLLQSEEVHHKDEDATNNDPSNFEVINGTKHRRIHKNKKVVTISVLCIWCKRKFNMDKQRQHDNKHNRKQGKKGPFCSRRCSGQYGVMIQNS